MLKLRYLFEDFELAKRALENWAHDTASLDGLLRQFRISSNAIYPFACGGNTCFLRLSPAGEKLRDNLAGELEYIMYLQAHGYAALCPVPAQNGKYLTTVSKDSTEYYACAFRKVPGIPIEDTDYSEEIMLAYGNALAQLHNLSSAFSPKTKKWAHDEVFVWIKQTLTEYHAPESALRELETLMHEFSALPMRQDNYGLVHYDFEPDNVFYDPGSKKCSVIDFDDSMYHWYALDLEQVFDCLKQELGADALPSAKDSFLRGYTKLRPYTQEMEDSLVLMRRFIDLYGYARLIRCVSEHFRTEPEWLIKLRLKLNRTIEQREQGFEKRHTPISG